MCFWVSHIVDDLLVVFDPQAVSMKNRRFLMFKKSTVKRYLLSVARATYVFATVAAVIGALALLNIGGH